MLYKNTWENLGSLLATFLLVLFLSADFYAAPGDSPTKFTFVSVSTVNVANIEELYSAVNDSQNAGSQIVIAPGVYMLSVRQHGNGPRPNGGRLELQENMSLEGVSGDREAVVIDASNLPWRSFETSTVPDTGAIRMGRGTNVVEWLTIRNAVNGLAGIESDIATAGTSFIRIAHIISTGNSRGIDVRNFGAAMAGRVIVAEIVDNDLYNNQIRSGSPACFECGHGRQGLRVANIVADGAVITVVMSGNRSHDNERGIIVANIGTNLGSVSVTSSSDRFYQNGLGAQIDGGFSVLNTANGNTISFTATGSIFENNNGQKDFDQGGMLVIAGANWGFPAGTSDNNVNVTLRNCRLLNNQLYDLAAAIGARSTPESIGSPGTNNRVKIDCQASTGIRHR